MNLGTNSQDWHEKGETVEDGPVCGGGTGDPKGMVRGHGKVSRQEPKKWKGGHLQVKTTRRMGCTGRQP